MSHPEKFVTYEHFEKVGNQLVDVLQKVQTSNQEVMAAVKGMSSGKGGSGTPPPPTPTPAAASASQAQAILHAMLNGDAAPLQAFIRENAKGAAEPDKRVEQLEQIAVTEAAERARTNLEAAKAQVESKFGAGSWEKYFADDFEAKMKDNPGWKANRTYVDNVIRLVQGEKFDELLTHRRAQETEAAAAAAAKEKEQAEMNRYPHMFGNGVPYTREGRAQFNSDDENFITKFEHNNGESFNRDRASKLLGAAAKATRDSNSPMLSVGLDDLKGVFAPPAGAQ